MKIANLLVIEAKGSTKNKLLALAAKPAPTKKQLLMKMAGVPKRMPTKYRNAQGRQFFLTLKGAYVIRTANGKTLYGRKSTDPTAPKAIRPKKRAARLPQAHKLKSLPKATHVQRVKAYTAY